ncbi:glutamine amidotransferase-related protein [Gilvimarinus sp. F26214L]|uniref:glutamine amidotransferase-related protein n=1 Tax=Gilvimarinus sp. DZF01 TaxID=3461371 RepID=UPI0040463996
MTQSMIIGLLEAETLPPPVVDRFGSYGDMFTHLLAPLDPALTFLYYAADQGQLPDRIDECDAYIITGSRHNAYDQDPWIEALKEFVRRLNQQQKRLLGICFGHQLIAQALGGRVRKSDRGWGIGAARFETRERPGWMSQPVPAFDIRVSHQDQVDILPGEACLFARSDFCPNGGYFVGEHIFSLQGHPEFSEDYVRYLINKRETLIGEPRVTEARNSLRTRGHNTALFRSWLGDFFNLQHV